MSPSILDERLAEIDRRLRSIQSELEPADDAGDGVATEPAPLRSVPEPPTDSAEERARRTVFVPGRAGDELDRAVDDLRELRDGHERLLELHRELLGQYAELLGERARDGAGVDGAPTATVTAGPFPAPDALREFERALAAIPGVAEVAVREFRDGDRVSLEVTLAGA